MSEMNVCPLPQHGQTAAAHCSRTQTTLGPARVVGEVLLLLLVTVCIA